MARRPVRTGRSTAERTTLIPAPTTTAMHSSAKQSDTGISHPRPANDTAGPWGAHQ